MTRALGKGRVHACYCGCVWLQSCQIELVKDGGHKYFLNVLADQQHMSVSGLKDVRLILTHAECFS